MQIKTKKTLIILTVVVLIASATIYYLYHENKSEVIFFDVGQGDSILINLPGNNEVLIDGGPDSTVLYKLGKYLPIYNRDIELMILTHPHADHITGLLEVLKRYKVKQVMYTDVNYNAENYNQFIKILKHENIKTIKISDINLDENNFLQIIYPWGNPKDLESENQNNNSIVVKLITKVGLNFLLTGDIEAEIEEILISKNNVGLKHPLDVSNSLDLSANILKVAHHGSITSSNQDFLQAVQPEQAIISVGKDNKFGHPSLRVIRRLERMGIEVLRTDEIGDIVIKIKDEISKIKNKD
ncbi:ComEC/Rec2 family competence protein [Patescibacteria group bacterium]